MSVFIVINDGKVLNEVFTSLKTACDRFGLSYSSASKGKIVFVVRDNEVIQIIKATVVKVKGRADNYKGIKNKQSD